MEVMPNHKIANATSSVLDMSPLKDLLGRTLTLKAKEEREVDDKTFHDDIVQRVVRAGWVRVVRPAVSTEPLVSTEPAALSEPPVEVLPEVAPPVVPEAPAAPPTSHKANKNRR